MRVWRKGVIFVADFKKRRNMIQKFRLAEPKMKDDGMKQRAKELVKENKELTLLKAINCILELAEDSELSKVFWDASHVFTDYVAERMKISPVQSVLMSLFIESGSTGHSASIANIARYTSCRNVRIMQYQQEVDDLVKRGFVRLSQKNYHQEKIYVIPSALLDALNKNEAYEKRVTVCSNVIELFQNFFELTHLRYEEELSTELLMEEVEDLIEQNKGLPFVRALLDMHIDLDDEMIIIHLCRHLVLDNEDSIDIDRISYLFDDKRERYNFRRLMMDQHHPLIVCGWVEQAFDGGFQSEKEFRLTEGIREKLLKGVELKLDSSSRCDVIEHKKIVKKDLFFSKDVDEHFHRLKQLLDEKEYQKICARLKKSGYREGFTCLFYGSPGTGKTESVMQLARQSGRDVLLVNISEVKSKWVGESEKNIKGIFDRYRYVVNNSKRVPILLFNEADALIGKRKSGAEQAVDKMENSIQNIILQEMENLKGIMIATTNLEENMDKAFERRFLYKVKFEKPDCEQRAHIWHSMMPNLDRGITTALASHYDFSGGQIENIARKYHVDCILYGKKAIGQETLEKYCQEECLAQQTTRIGFVK